MLPSRLCRALILAAMPLAAQGEGPDWAGALNDSCRAPLDPAADARVVKLLPFSDDGKSSRKLSEQEIAQLVGLVDSPDDCVAAGAAGHFFLFWMFKAIPEFPPQLIASLKRSLESGDRWPVAGQSVWDERVKLLDRTLRILAIAKTPGLTGAYARVTKLESWGTSEVVGLAVAGLCGYLPGDKAAEDIIGAMLDRGSTAPLHSLRFTKVIPASFAPALARLIASFLESEVTVSLHAASILVRIPRSERGVGYDDALWQLVRTHSERSETGQISEALRK